MDNATSKYVLGVARAPGSGQFPTTDQSAMRIPFEWLTIQELSDFVHVRSRSHHQCLTPLRKSKITQLDTEILLWHTPIDGRWEC
jgi:hypothetical protein